MIQQLRMIKHFIVWCVKGVGTSIIDAVKSLTAVHRIFIDCYKTSKEAFAKSFSYGLLNAILSMLVTFGMVMGATGVIYWGDLSQHHEDVFTILRYSLSCTAMFYTVAYIHSLYEKFLTEYNHVWNMLKDNEEK